MRKDFAVFILTHGRAQVMKTVQALLTSNYKGKLYFIVDNEDKTINEYYTKFGKENVIIFDKEKIMKKVDACDNFNEKKAILYARIACFEIAKEKKLNYFLQLDDDYTQFQYRYISEDHLKGDKILNINKVFNAMIDFIKNTDCLTIAFCQGGDFIGGINSNAEKGLLRKAMNSFFCRTSKPIDFRGTMNEDVTMYTNLGSRGNLIFSVPLIDLVQLNTQSLEGGMSSVYSEGGTYQKAFYTVINQPSSVKINMIFSLNARIHHNVKWNNAVPKILKESIKK